jgi:hypothetical protein
MSNNCYNSELPMGPQGPIGPPGPPGPQGSAGTNGTNGTNGNTILSGLIAPTTEGVDGDYYIDTTTDTIYGPKTLGVWGSGTSLIGPIGPAGPTGSTGANGTNGVNGTNGNNAYTLTTNTFIQPAVNTTVTIEISDSSWMSFNQVVFVGNPTGLTDIGGYYLVTNIFSVGVINYAILYRLNWIIPGVTFVSDLNVVPSGSIVQSSGTVGASSELAYVQNSLWGSYLGTGGINDKKVSILVPANTLDTVGNILECQVVLKATPTTSTVRGIYIKVSPNDTATIATTAADFQVPISSAPGNIVLIHINSKIERVGGSGTGFRAKSECYVSFQDASASLFTQDIEYSYVCSSLSNLTAVSSGWLINQYIVVSADDEASPMIEVINHEVKVVKKKI